MEYLSLGSGKRGLKGVSTYVLNQIAIDGILSMLEGDFKGQFELDKTRKGYKVSSHVDKRNKPSIEIEISVMDGIDASKISAEVQKEVYEGLLDFLEVTPAKVNVKVSHIRKAEKKG